MNTLWNILKITTFWESHWQALWVIVDWFPVWMKIDMKFIQSELDRRKPWQSNITTQRKEDNSFEILSWIFEWKTTGHPIMMIVYNENQKSKDYTNIKDLFRPNHADLTYHQKYDGIRDYRWWWRSSWRETVSRVLAWALAKQYLKEKLSVEIFGFTKQIWKYKVKNVDYSFIEQNKLRTADREVADDMVKLAEQMAGKWDSIGWIIECHIKNPPANLWEPTFWKIKAVLASSMLSIWWVLWFEYWLGFDTVNETGMSYNEWFINKDWKIQSEHNKYGWILWWISTGEDIIFRIAVKPTSSIYKKQKTVNISWEAVDFQVRWRHDPTILPRVIPVVESMVALNILDLYLLDKSKR